MNLIVGTEEQVDKFLTCHVGPPTEEQSYAHILMYEMNLPCFNCLHKSSLLSCKKITMLSGEEPWGDVTVAQMEVALGNGCLVVEVDI